MALKASGFTGTSCLHDVKDTVCDLCGLEADSEFTDVTALDCSCLQCPAESAWFHQACLEKYLKSINCERNRKIGFPCPRGCGKGTNYPEPCRGKIKKSHPVSTRGEANKKRRQAELDQLAKTMAEMQQAKGKDRKEEAKEREREKEKAAKAAAAAKGKGKEGKPKTVVIKALNVANTALTRVAPPKTAEQTKKEQLAAAAAHLREQLAAKRNGSGGSSGGGAATVALARVPSGKLAGRKETRTLDEYLAERSGSTSAPAPAPVSAPATLPVASQPAVMAWGKAGGGAADPSPAVNFTEAFPPPPVSAPQPAAPRVVTVSVAHRKPPAATPAPAAAPPQGVWGQKQPAAVASIVPPPPPPPRAGAGVATAMGMHPPTAGGAGKVIPGMESEVEAAGGGEAPKLSKAQRKNLKRLEKKAGRADESAPEEEVASVGDDATHHSELSASDAGGGLGYDAAAGSEDALADAAYPGGGSEAFDRCMQLVVQHKLQAQVDQLAQLGFPPAAAAAAVQQHGGNLEAAAATLLEQACGVQDSQGPTGSAAPGEVDLSDELGAMQMLTLHYGLAPGVVEAVVMDCGGDVALAVSTLGEQCGPAPAPAQPAGLGQVRADLYESSPSQPSAVGIDWGGGAGGLPGISGAAGNAFSAFAFGGLAEAALHAVHGNGLAAAPQPSLFGSMDGGELGSSSGYQSGMWGEAASPVPMGSSQASNDPHLLSLLGVTNGHLHNGAATSHAGLGLFSGTQQLGQYDASGHSSPFPGSVLQAPMYGGAGQEQLSGLQQHQQWDGGVSSASALWGSAPTRDLGDAVFVGHRPQQLQQQQQQQQLQQQQQQLQQAGVQYGSTLEENELNELMATLLCR